MVLSIYMQLVMKQYDHNCKGFNYSLQPTMQVLEFSNYFLLIKLNKCLGDT